MNIENRRNEKELVFHKIYIVNSGGLGGGLNKNNLS